MRTPFEQPHVGLLEAISPFNCMDLLKCAAGLQLQPENADRATRLEILASAIASVPYTQDAPNISTRRLKKILNDGPLSSDVFVSTEDPFNNPFVEELAFHGGSYKVLPGFDGTPTFVMRHLLMALFRLRDPSIDATFSKETYQATMAILLVSTWICDRAGLNRCDLPVEDFDGSVVFPGSARYNELKTAVAFEIDKISRDLLMHNIPIEAIEPFVVDFGQVVLNNADTNPTDLAKQPLVTDGYEYVVALPSLLLDSLRNRIVDIGIEHHQIPLLASRYTNVVWKTVLDSLSRLRCTELGFPFELEATGKLREGLFLFDSDKVMHVSLICDDLSDYNSDDMFEWHVIDEAVTEILTSRIEHVFFQLSSLPRGAPNEILFLVIVQNIGRGLVCEHIGADVPLMLSMTASELETLSCLSGEDQLSLWKYACALNRFEQECSVVSWSQLDVFDLFREHNRSFYVSDESVPDLLNVVPYGAGKLRREVQSTVDIHPVVSCNGDQVIVVGALHEANVIPEYVELESLGEKVEILVEGYSIPIWFIAPTGRESDCGDLFGLRAEICDAIAYWVWQLQPSLDQILSKVEPAPNRLLFIIDVVEGSQWETIRREDLVSTDDAITVSANAALSTIEIVLKPCFSMILLSSDNVGERKLVEAILCSIKELLPQDHQHLLADTAISAILDKYVPIGSKKKIFYLDISSSPVLDPIGLPKFRPVQDYDRQVAIDEVSSFLLRDGIEVGDIVLHERARVLNKAVDYLFGEFEKTVRSLDSSVLLETFIALYEKDIQERHFNRLTIPTRIACFGTDSDIIKELQTEIPRIATASLVCRFIIEYMAARPPCGLRPISLSVIDRLQALAELIISFGTTSDILYYRLADVSLEMLPSRRIAVEREEYESALDAFYPAYLSGVADSAETSFHRHWEMTEESAPAQLISKLNRAFQAEFTFDLEDLVTFISEVIQISTEAHSVVACYRKDELVGLLNTRLDWPAEKTQRVLVELTSSQRSDFLNPAEPFKRNDVYPWRFNRRLSYLRRPFVLRENGGTIEILWGKRNVYESGKYLLRLCMDGRLAACSDEMVELMGSIRHRDGHLFSAHVAQFFEKDRANIVRSNVKKTGRVKCDRDIPGDIDVLVVNETKMSIRVIECKDMTSAFEPKDIARELKNLFVDSEHKRSSVVTKHKARLKWVEDHTNEIMEWLGLSSKGDWSIEPYLVTNRRSIVRYLHDSPIPIRTLADFDD